MGHLPLRRHTDEPRSDDPFEGHSRTLTDKGVVLLRGRSSFGGTERTTDEQEKQSCDEHQRQPDRHPDDVVELG